MTFVTILFFFVVYLFRGVIMLNFSSDYLEGATPEILESINKINYEKVDSYGLDKYSVSAKNKIRKEIGNKDAEVFFLSGGTQTNLVFISAALRSYEAVLACNTGHINFHEAGAIELTGHKVLALPNHLGKIQASDIVEYMEGFSNDANHEHMAHPGMIYISNPTEYGTIYKKSELEEISKVARKYDLLLYLDGARLGYGLIANENDLSLRDIATLCDAFYIGGTKVGALFGEALVITKKNLIPHMFTIIKQHGALLAKGKILGIQFDTLFTDNLYFKISKNAITMANLLDAGLKEKGYKFFLETESNQLFIVLNQEKIDYLKDKVNYGYWETLADGSTVVRLATSFATTKEEIEELLSIL